MDLSSLHSLGSDRPLLGAAVVVACLAGGIGAQSADLMTLRLHDDAASRGAQGPVAGPPLRARATMVARAPYVSALAPGRNVALPRHVAAEPMPGLRRAAFVAPAVAPAASPAPVARLDFDRPVMPAAAPAGGLTPLFTAAAPVAEPARVVDAAPSPIALSSSGMVTMIAAAAPLAPVARAADGDGARTVAAAVAPAPAPAPVGDGAPALARPAMPSPAPGIAAPADALALVGQRDDGLASFDLGRVGHLARSHLAAASATSATAHAHPGASSRGRDSTAGEFVFHKTDLQIAGQAAGTIAVRIGGDARPAVRIADLLKVVSDDMDSTLHARLSSSAAAGEWISFAALRDAGFNVGYDAGADRISLAAAR